MNEEELFMVFRQGTIIRDKEGKLIGRGFFERELMFQGFERKELRDLVKTGKLLKVTTIYQGGWRNTLVMPMLIESQSE